VISTGPAYGRDASVLAETTAVHNGAMDTSGQGTALAALAAHLADDTRASFCVALLDGRAWTAGELARHAGVAASTASEHLSRLVAAGLLTERRQGRHRYVELADARTAEMLEDLLSHLGPLEERPRTFRAGQTAAALAGARTCYDHLAGRLGVAVHDAMLDARLLSRREGLAVTARGRDWFAGLGIDLDALEGQRRAFLRDCVDLTERRPHLAGHVGAALCDTFADRDWVRRPDRSRALVVTPLGERALGELLGIRPADLVVA
jgi:DNA-binding transcriptional ArsR family regulator